MRNGATLASLRLAAHCARLADHAYWDCSAAAQAQPSEPPATAPLAALLAPDGLRLVAAGRSAHTSYYVADEPAARTRHVVFRGVAWRDARLDAAGLSQRLVSAWRHQPESSLPLFSHAGVQSLADALLPALEPLLLGSAAEPGWRLALSGHSLGGSLATLTAVACRTRLAMQPDALAPVHAFGSPPVLLAEPASFDALSLLQLPPDGFRSFVLDTDPVPSVWSGRAGGGLGVLSAAQGALMGAMGTAFRHFGDVYFLSWEGSAEASMTLLAAAGGEAPRGEGPPSLLGMLRGALDHNRRSYSEALAWLLKLAESAETSAR